MAKSCIRKFASCLCKGSNADGSAYRSLATLLSDKVSHFQWLQVCGNCVCLYSEGVSSHSPGLPRIAATLGNGYRRSNLPQRGCAILWTQTSLSIPNISLVVFDLVTFQKLTQLRFEVFFAMMLFLLLNVFDDLFHLRLAH